MNVEEDRFFWAACSSCPQLSCADVHACFHYFESGEHAWHASHEQLVCAGLSSEHARAFFSFRDSYDLSHLRRSLTAHDIRILLFTDTDYPSLLLDIFDPPAVLFVRGTLHSPIPHPLAVVGSRNMTAYGQQIIDRIITPVARAGCSIISGLAYGCDAAAHEAALACQTYTIAVLGTGVDDVSIYPKKNFSLAQRILSHDGALMSEFCPGTPGMKHHFPLRNRIISGMSAVTCVIEAARTSGSLITARIALDQNRTVCSVPGSIFSAYSAGCNDLIAAGARPVLSAQDILDEYGISLEVTQPSYTPANEHEALLLSLLSDQPMYIDDIISRSLLSAAAVMSCLTVLESKRIVKQISGMTYVLTV